MNQLKQILDKYSFYFSILVSFIISGLFTLTPLWQLTIIAGIFGGFLCLKMKHGALGSMIGVVLSWGIYILVKIIGNNTNVLFDQLGTLIIGSTGLGFLFILIVLIVGAIFGFLGGAIGSGIRILVENRIIEEKSDSN